MRYLVAFSMVTMRDQLFSRNIMSQNAESCAKVTVCFNICQRSLLAARKLCELSASFLSSYEEEEIEKEVTKRYMPEAVGGRNAGTQRQEFVLPDI